MTTKGIEQILKEIRNDDPLNPETKIRSEFQKFQKRRYRPPKTERSKAKRLRNRGSGSS
jgi:hypothetical protein